MVLISSISLEEEQRTRFRWQKRARSKTSRERLLLVGTVTYAPNNELQVQQVRSAEGGQHTTLSAALWAASISSCVSCSQTHSETNCVTRNVKMGGTHAVGSAARLKRVDVLVVIAHCIPLFHDFLSYIKSKLTALGVSQRTVARRHRRSQAAC